MERGINDNKEVGIFLIILGILALFNAIRLDAFFDDEVSNEIAVLSSVLLYAIIGCTMFISGSIFLSRSTNG